MNKSEFENKLLKDESGKAGPKPQARYGADALRIWENLKNELVSLYIKKNEEGKDTFPTSTWFVRNRTDVARAVNLNKGFKAVIKRLQDEGHLAKDYVPVMDENLTPAKGPVLVKSLGDWENFVPVMMEICRKLGQFPKTYPEIKALGHADAANAIDRHYDGLINVERRMRSEGLLDFLSERKEDGQAKEQA